MNEWMNEWLIELQTLNPTFPNELKWSLIIEKNVTILTHDLTNWNNLLNDLNLKRKVLINFKIHKTGKNKRTKSYDSSEEEYRNLKQVWAIANWNT